jgi:two-component system, NtrC family, sensor histidine kinase GlrK
MAFPQTLTKLIVGCFLLTAIPLLLALGQLALNVNELANLSQTAVKRGEQAGAVGRELRESATSLERAVRQSVVLEDTSLLKDITRASKSTQTVIERAMNLPLPDAELLKLTELSRQVKKLGRAFEAGLPAEANRKAVVEQVLDITEHSERAAVAVNKVTATEIAVLQNKATEGRENWPWLIGAAAVLALTLGLGFSFWIARPLRSLDRSMRRLGQARFDEPVHIKGPRDLENLGERLEWLRSRLHTLESEQSRFLQQVSHELKTPLTAIREGGELLHDRVTGELTVGQADIVRIIRDNSVQLQKHISDLLTYQQHRSGVPLRIEKMNLPDLVVQVLREHKLDVLAKSLDIRPKIVSVVMQADRDRIRVILDNLVSNAIKFSPNGGLITITAQTELVGDIPSVVLLVEDQGQGIAVNEQEKIFDSFYQGSHQPKTTVKGSGLGLAIVKEYVLAHAGQISVVGAGEPGGRLQVMLPIQTTATP